MPLFEVAILEKPNPKQEEEGKSDRLVMPPMPVVAADLQSAVVCAVMDDNVPSAVKGMDKSRMEVLVRPFA